MKDDVYPTADRSGEGGDADPLRAELTALRRENARLQRRERELIDYLRCKIDNLLRMIGTFPLRAEELDDEHMINFDPIGIITDAFGHILDNLRDTNEQLSLARDEIAAIFDAAGAGILVLDRERHILSCNQKVVDLFGLGNRQQALGQTCVDLLCHNQVDVVNCVFFKVLRSGHSEQTFNWKFMERYFDVLGAPVKNADNDTVQVVIVYQEVTARRQAEHALQAALENAREARDRIDSIVRSVSEGILVVDASGRVHLANPAAEQIVGLSQKQMLDRPLTALLNDSNWREQLDRALTAGEAPPPFDLQLTDPAPGAGRCLQIRTALLRNSDNTPGGLVLTLQDVTQERSIEQMKSEFVSTAAHELRTPLCTILGFSELLLDSTAFSREEQQEFLAHIHHKAEDLSNVIDDLLDVSRIESGMGIQLDRKPIAVTGLVEQSIDFFRRGSPHHTFQFLAPEQSLTADIDPLRVGQILDNLLSNAVKYSPGGGTICVQIVPEGAWCKIAVSDRGIGMTPEQVAKVFDKFYRADASNTAIAGTGLGMTIVRELVRAHGGDVEVESSAGFGTTVSFTLPMS